MKCPQGVTGENAQQEGSMRHYSKAVQSMIKVQEVGAGGYQQHGYDGLMIGENVSRAPSGCGWRPRTVHLGENGLAYGWVSCRSQDSKDHR